MIRCIDSQYCKYYLYRLIQLNLTHIFNWHLDIPKKIEDGFKLHLIYYNMYYKLMKCFLFYSYFLDLLGMHK